MKNLMIGIILLCLLLSCSSNDNQKNSETPTKTNRKSDLGSSKQILGDTLLLGFREGMNINQVNVLEEKLIAKRIFNLEVLYNERHESLNETQYLFKAKKLEIPLVVNYSWNGNYLSSVNLTYSDQKLSNNCKTILNTYMKKYHFTKRIDTSNFLILPGSFEYIHGKSCNLYKIKELRRNCSICRQLNANGSFNYKLIVTTYIDSNKRLVIKVTDHKLPQKLLANYTNCDIEISYLDKKSFQEFNESIIVKNPVIKDTKVQRDILDEI